MPELYVIAGPNGAGKTTASLTILPEILKITEFINADSIAAGISPFNVESVAFQSARIMLGRIQQMLDEGKNFAFETTLTTKSYVELVKKAKSRGYKVNLIFFWLKNVELAKYRVQNRVRLGGHNIPETVIERRYYRGIHNLFNHFIPLCNVWTIFDNSTAQPLLVAKGVGIVESDILDNETFEELKKYVK